MSELLLYRRDLIERVATAHGWVKDPQITGEHSLAFYKAEGSRRTRTVRVEFTDRGSICRLGINANRITGADRMKQLMNELCRWEKS